MVRRYRRGLSELVVIMIAVAIAIPVMFLLQTWLTGQISKMPELDAVTASYSSKMLNNNSILVTISVNNNGNEPISLTGVGIIYTSQTSQTESINIDASSQSNLLSGSLPANIDPKSSTILAVKVNNAVRIDSVIVTVKSLSSNAIKTIKASGI